MVSCEARPYELALGRRHLRRAWSRNTRRPARADVIEPPAQSTMIFDAPPASRLSRFWHRAPCSCWCRAGPRSCQNRTGVGRPVRSVPRASLPAVRNSLVKVTMFLPSYCRRSLFHAIHDRLHEVDAETADRTIGEVPIDVRRLGLLDQIEWRRIVGNHDRQRGDPMRLNTTLRWRARPDRSSRCP